MKNVKTIDVLKFLPNLFGYVDVAKFVSNPNVFLTRALKAKYVERISRGLYYNTLKKRPEFEEVACVIKTPSYISCEWALSYHNIILQVPLFCTVVTLGTSVGKRSNIVYRKIVIEFSKISEKLFNGYETANNFNMALPEKALLDTTYLRKHIPFKDEIEVEHLNLHKLAELSKSYPKTVQRKIEELMK